MPRCIYLADTHCTMLKSIMTLKSQIIKHFINTVILKQMFIEDFSDVYKMSS
jgi:hypothetical protein